MVSKEEARKIALKALKDDSLTVERDECGYDGVHIFYMLSKEFVKTRNPGDMLIGPGPMIIDKETGYLLQYGSLYSTEKAVEDYRALKIKWNIIKNDFPNFDIQTNYNIIITKVTDLDNLIKLILKLRFQYIIPEVEGDTVWRISHDYSKKILRSRLKNQPTIFKDILARSVLEFYEIVSFNKLCEFDLDLYLDQRKEWKASNLSDLDLEPKW